jgi:hypothetical protein
MKFVLDSNIALKTVPGADPSRPNRLIASYKQGFHKLLAGYTLDVKLKVV